MNEVSNDGPVQSLIGTILAGRYRIDSLLGEGGMGAVYRGYHLHLRRDFAIKVLHPDVTRDPDIGRRFEREAQSAARLDHPNCIQVTEFGTTDDGTRYMVMQLLEGVELQDLIRGPMEPLRALDLFLQILHGLEHAHSKGVIHRDLKPQNVFVSRDDKGDEVLKIVDFGIAKLVSGEGAAEQMTRAGMVFGTPLYMSPEQCLGLTVDARSDLYSAGILLYLMLSGRLPFVGDDPVAVIRMQVSQDPPPLPEHVPTDLAAIDLRLLAKQRENRYADASTVRKILEGYRKNLATRIARGETPAEINASRILSNYGPPPSFHTALPDTLQPRESGAFRSDRLRPLLYVVIALALVGVIVGVVVYGGVDPTELEGDRRPRDVAAQTSSSTSEAPTSAGAADPSEGSTSDASESAVLGPSDAEMLAIDEFFRANQYDQGALLLGPLRERYPQNAGLLWREGWLINWRDHDRAQALARFKEALERDGALADNRAFLKDLGEVLRYPDVRATAVDIAVELGPSGYEHLVYFLNDPDVSVGYAQRHRALNALAAAPEFADQVNREQSLLHDVDQHREAPRPCVALTEALKAILAKPALVYLEPVRTLTLPKPAAGASAEETSACAGLPPLLESAKKKLEKLAPKTKKKKRVTKKKKR
ncbi:MAG: serine/threonine-protein kinase [Nannocystaceae bacterium]